jgi:hypothetical protein
MRDRMGGHDEHTRRDLFLSLRNRRRWHSFRFIAIAGATTLAGWNLVHSASRGQSNSLCDRLFFDGLILKHQIIDDSLLNIAPPKFNRQFVEFASNVIIRANTQMERLFTRVTAAQIRDGLNGFYADTRNLRVLVFDAAFVPANAVAGSPTGRVEALPKTYRVSDTT